MELFTPSFCRKKEKFQFQINFTSSPNLIPSSLENYFISFYNKVKAILYLLNLHILCGLFKSMVIKTLTKKLQINYC